MTTIYLKRNHQKQLVSISLENHAGFAEAGSDVVCAILSTASQSVLLGLEEVLKLEEFSYTVSDGFLSCEIDDSVSFSQREKADVLLETMVLVLKQAEEQFPSYLKIEESEV